MQNAWTKFKGYGTDDVYLEAKLKYLKEEISNWRRSEHKKKIEDLVNLKAMIASLGKIAESHTLSDIDSQTRSKRIQRVLELDKLAVLD